MTPASYWIRRFRSYELKDIRLRIGLVSNQYRPRRQKEVLPVQGVAFSVSSG